MKLQMDVPRMPSLCCLKYTEIKHFRLQLWSKIGYYPKYASSVFKWVTLRASRQYDPDHEHTTLCEKRRFMFVSRVIYPQDFLIGTRNFTLSRAHETNPLYARSKIDYSITRPVAAPFWKRKSLMETSR